MIKVLKNKLLNKDNIKYIAISILLICATLILCIITKITSSRNGVVINKIPILEVFDDNKIGVYIDGEVNKSGYIKINKGDTLEQAINKAGGITKAANIQNIDLKRKLKNQEKIIIPAIKEELMEETDFENNDKLININIASKEELMVLEGIGEKTADYIIKYREIKRFDTIEEIMDVKGIGESKFSKIKENICI